MRLLSRHPPAGRVPAGPAEEEDEGLGPVGEDERPDDGPEAATSRNSRRIAARSGPLGIWGALTRWCIVRGTLCRRRAPIERPSARSKPRLAGRERLSRGLRA